jgi:hypothetical protein
MSDRRIPIYFLVDTGIYLALSADEDLYSQTVRSKVFALATAPNGSKILPINRRYAIASGVVVEKIAKCERSGIGGVTLTRDVPILVSREKLSTIGDEIKDVVLKLGRGSAPVDWTVKRLA